MHGGKSKFFGLSFCCWWLDFRFEVRGFRGWPWAGGGGLGWFGSEETKRTMSEAKAVKKEIDQLNAKVQKIKSDLNDMSRTFPFVHFSFFFFFFFFAFFISFFAPFPLRSLLSATSIVVV
jgi:hypothetical protein